MEDRISRDWNRPGRDPENAVRSMGMSVHSEMGGFPLCLAREGDRVRIVSVHGKRGFHDRLAGVGLKVGAEVQVLHNAMKGKLLLGYEGSRLFLGGGMAQRICVIAVEGETT